jgi:hypothetical protein
MPANPSNGSMQLEKSYYGWLHGIHDTLYPIAGYRNTHQKLINV